MLIIQQLDYEERGQFGEIGRYDSEEGIISGEEELLSLLPREEWQAHSEERLMGMMNGPRVIAGQIDNQNNDYNAIRSDDIEMTEHSTEIPTSEDEAEISLSELDDFLYECADIIRNRVDKTDYKEYILPLVFYKTFHDTYNDNYRRAVKKKREEGISEQKATVVAHDEAYHDVTVPRDLMWDDLMSADNTALAVDRALREFQESNDQFTGIAEMDDYADVDAFTKTEGNRLEELLRHLDTQNLSRYCVPPDLVGEAYMNLVKHFAQEEGRDGGEFFTPPEIVELMVRILEPYEKNVSIHDPTCGAGGMLIKVGEHLRKVQNVSEDHWRSMRFTGQEVNETVHAMAEMNLAIHDVEGEIRIGDSLSSPQFTTGNAELEQFDYVLANFPFSMSKWKDDTKPRAKQFGDLNWGDSLPHGSYGDFAFIMHMFSHLNEHGQMASVIPHGVLFRNADQEYREYMIEHDLVEAVIGLPENLFQSTGIPIGILILNKDKPDNRQNEVMFFNVDHEDRFYKDTGSDRYKLLDTLPEYTHADAVENADGLAEINQLFNTWTDEKRVCRVVSNEKIRENEYNMNIALYVDTTEPQENIDVQETIESVQKLENEYNQLNDQFTTYMQQLNYEDGKNE